MDWRGRLAADHARFDSAGHGERERRADAVPPGLVEDDHRCRRRRAEFRARTHRQGEAAVRPAGSHEASRADGVFRRRSDDRPGLGTQGLGTQRVFLGTAIPGDVPGNFHAALTQLGDRATYFYTGSGKYWYDLQPNITRAAKDQAERLHKEDVWAEIVRRASESGSHPRRLRRCPCLPGDKRRHPRH